MNKRCANCGFFTPPFMVRGYNIPFHGMCQGHRGGSSTVKTEDGEVVMGSPVMADWSCAYWTERLDGVVGITDEEQKLLDKLVEMLSEGDIEGFTAMVASGTEFTS